MLILHKDWSAKTSYVDQPKENFICSKIGFILDPAIIFCNACIIMHIKLRLVQWKYRNPNN